MGENFSAAFLIAIVIITTLPNTEQQAVEAMSKCRALNPEPFAVHDCMNYQGFKVAGQSVTEVTNYVPMYGWEHGWLKRIWAPFFSGPSRQEKPLPPTLPLPPKE